MRRLGASFAGAIGVFVFAATNAAGGTGIDPSSGLKIAPDWELVRSNCSACHSTALITQQSGSTAQWLGMIRWMQETQNLWQFEPGIEQRIVSYLAENYPPRPGRRRAPIPPDLMPPDAGPANQD
jgi:hypothetical protein